MRVRVTDDVGGGETWEIKNGVLCPPALTTVDQSAVTVPLTGTTAELVMKVVPLVGLAFREKDSVHITSQWSAPGGSANSKSVRTRFGLTGSGVAGQDLGGATFTSNLSYSHGGRLVQAKGTSNEVTRAASLGSGGAAAASVFTTVNTMVATAIVFTGQLANAADSLILEGYLIKLLRFDLPHRNGKLNDVQRSSTTA